MTVKIAVVYYSATGNVHALAKAVSEGAEKEGAEVRVRRVPDLVPDPVVEANPAWLAHREAAETVPMASHSDLLWADGYAFGSPTRYGNVSAQLKQFIDSTVQLWMDGAITGKSATAFTSAINMHGGNEATLLALYNTFYHWGAVIVPPGYLDATVSAAYGNPYGTAHPSSTGAVSEETLAAARFQGSRLASVTRKLLTPERD